MRELDNHNISWRREVITVAFCDAYEAGTLSSVKRERDVSAIKQGIELFEKARD